MNSKNNPVSIRVYWEDTDAGGIVFYANYLKYFERARTEWLRSRGVQQSTLQAEMDCLFVVAEANLRWLSPARLDDLLTVTLQVSTVSNASIQMEQQAWRGEVLLAEASVRIACVRSSDMRPRRIPEQIRALL